MQQLRNTLPQVGRVEWISVRPSKKEPAVVVADVQALVDAGLEGDRWRGRPGSSREVTLIQKEHLAVIAGCLGLDTVSPILLRRNIMVSGINLLALKDKRIMVGEAILEYSSLAHPCSKMEADLGPGGYNAMRGHGGITARVLQSGLIRTQDDVVYLSD